EAFDAEQAGLGVHADQARPDFPQIDVAQLADRAALAVDRFGDALRAAFGRPVSEREVSQRRQAVAALARHRGVDLARELGLADEQLAVDEEPVDALRLAGGVLDLDAFDLLALRRYADR